jgi:hypothetical protein
MQDIAIPEKMLYGKLYATRRRGRPRMRWLDDVSMDLRKMGVSRWRDRARNREAWRRIVEEAKAHPRAVVLFGRKERNHCTTGRLFNLLAKSDHYFACPSVRLSERVSWNSTGFP